MNSFAKIIFKNGMAVFNFYSLCIQDEFHGRLLNLEYEINPPANRDGDLDADKECKDDIDNRIWIL
jgi:hypothetical protein